MVLRDKNAPRWLIFFIDLGISLFSIILAYLLRFNFELPENEVPILYRAIPFVLVIRGGTFVLFKTYAGIVRFTSTEDAKRILIVITLGSLAYCLANGILYYGFNTKYLLPFSVIIIDYLATNFILIAGRVSIKLLYFEIRKTTRTKLNVVVYGAGELGITTKRSLDNERSKNYNVIAFVDDNPSKSGKRLEGTKIMPTSKLDELLANEDVDQLIIAIQNPSVRKKQAVIETCLTHRVQVSNIPPLAKWIDGKFTTGQIRDIHIEDLLGRDPIKLDNDTIRSKVKNKRVLVTGAAGSIGSELVRQISSYEPAQIILLDQSESPTYDFMIELEGTKFKNFEVVIGDIRNLERMHRLFTAFKPQLIFHAAAYKHVPLMEENPSEAVLTNVLGTKNLVDLADKFEVEEFVMISTDKAVNPTSVMGASKRIAEIYAQATNENSKTKFITTRFGNVLGSNGSVIPLFRKQIEKGGPVTVTHPEVTRYFMTIPEACQLVMEASAMGQGGEIFVFDMGTSVKIIDLAKKMIKLSGLELGRDIKIKISGLRPGEKLYEELLANEESTLPTHHSQIMIAETRRVAYEEVERNIGELVALFQDQNNELIVRKMKEIVPEYKSNNSIFANLDR